MLGSGDERHRCFYVDGKMEFAFWYKEGETQHQIMEDFEKTHDWKFWVNYCKIKEWKSKISEDGKRVDIITNNSKDYNKKENSMEDNVVGQVGTPFADGMWRECKLAIQSRKTGLVLYSDSLIAKTKEEFQGFAKALSARPARQEFMKACTEDRSLLTHRFSSSKISPSE